MNDVKRRESEVAEFTKRAAYRKLEMQQSIDAYVTAESLLALAHDRLERARDSVLAGDGISLGVAPKRGN
jgi:hypothetical protein